MADSEHSALLAPGRDQEEYQRLILMQQSHVVQLGERRRCGANQIPISWELLVQIVIDRAKFA